MDTDQLPLRAIVPRHVLVSVAQKHGGLPIQNKDSLQDRRGGHKQQFQGTVAIHIPVGVGHVLGEIIDIHRGIDGLRNGGLPLAHARGIGRREGLPVLLGGEEGGVLLDDGSIGLLLLFGCHTTAGAHGRQEQDSGEQDAKNSFHHFFVLSYGVGQVRGVKVIPLSAGFPKVARRASYSAVVISVSTPPSTL